jgi:hypothetical protein
VRANEPTAWRGLALKEIVDVGAEHGSEVTSHNILLQGRQNTEVAVGMMSPKETVSTLERRVVQVSVREYSLIKGVAKDRGNERGLKSISKGLGRGQLILLRK